MDAWRTVRVADLAAPGANSMATGPFGSSIGAKYFRPSGVPVIRGSNLSADSLTRLSDENLVYLDPAKGAEFARSTARRGDLIFTCWGTINQVGLIDESAAHDAYVVSNKQMKLTPDPAVADAEFLYYLFSSPKMQQVILEGAIGSSIPGFNLTRLRSLRIELPPLNAQKRIALVLADAERFEVRLGEAVAKKQAVKQGVLQQLLTGATRLPGFHGDWRWTDIGSHATGLRGAGLRKDQVDSSGAYSCILYGELFTRYGQQITEVYSRTDAAGAVRSQAGDVLVPGSTTTVARDLATASALHVQGVILGGDMNVIRPGPELDPDWLAQYITHRLGGRIAEVAQGLTIKHLYVRDLLRCQIELPPLAEQRAIVDVLGDLEAEISQSRSQLEKARAVRRGMMQRLLSDVAPRVEEAAGR
jgi:hypothetical protein